MRMISILILIAFAFMALSPTAVLCLQSGPDDESIGMLNVCHKSISGVNPDLPCISECSCLPLPLTRNELNEIANPSFKHLLIAFQEERPPKV